MNKSIYYSHIARIYEEVTGKESDGLEEKTMARALVEAFGDRNMITQSDENLCATAFRNFTEFESLKRKQEFLLFMEEKLDPEYKRRNPQVAL